MIRKAEKTDIPQMAEIYEELHLTHCEIRSDFYKAPTAGFYLNALEKQFENDNNHIIVDEENGVITAYAIFFIFEKGDEICFDMKCCFIDQFAVRSSYRRKGVGTQLMDFIRSFARKESCTSLDLGVWYENAVAMGFYKNFGFKPRTVKMELKLK